VLPDASRLEAMRAHGEGTRRLLRLLVAEVEISGAGDGLTVSFVLPKGGYATTVLASACRLVDPSARGGASDDDASEALPEPDCTS
jgi:tRNA pseudouridine13 synthase